MRLVGRLSGCLRDATVPDHLEYAGCLRITLPGKFIVSLRSEPAGTQKINFSPN
jgi:hypothetical protein